MGRHVVTKRLQADVDGVWTLLGDLTNIEWMPPTKRVEWEGSGPGMRRWIYGSTDTPTVERLIAMEPGRRHFEYEIEENNPLPVTSYVVTVDVGAEASGDTIVSWAVDYETDEEDRVVAGIDAVYSMIAGWLEDAASAGRTDAVTSPTGGHLPVRHGLT